MRKVDVLLVALGVVAAAATTVAVAKSDDWTGERTYTFHTGEAALAAQGPFPAGAAPARFEWPTPANATGATLDIEVAFNGQAVRGGIAVVRIAGVAPDGTNLAPVTYNLPIGQGATTSDATIPFNATWAQTPGKARDTQPPQGLQWERPLIITLTVERPSDLPAAAYAFTATASGAFATYAA